MKEMDFYVLTMEINVDGKTEKESYVNLSLNDFEVIYGNETRDIFSIMLTKQPEFYTYKGGKNNV